jgi:hypothetical protein
LENEGANFQYGFYWFPVMLQFSGPGLHNSLSALSERIIKSKQLVSEFFFSLLTMDSWM